MRRISLMVAAMVLFVSVSYSQLDTRVFLSPRIKLGWTFYSGFNYGAEIAIGLFNIKKENPEINVCISPQYMLVNYKGNVHSILSFNAVLESDFYRVMLGIGSAQTKWGFRNRNSNSALGYNISVALTTESKYSPWVECNVFALHNGYWEFYGRPFYLSGSMFFRPDPYLVYEKK